MTSEAGSRRGILRFAPWIASAVLAFVVWQVVPAWVQSWWTGLVGTSRRSISVAFLNGCLAAHGVILASAAVAVVVATSRIISGRKRGLRRTGSARVLLLSVASLLGLGLLELGSRGLELWTHMPPRPPPVPAQASSSGDGSTVLGDEFTVLVVGESSAEGQPFQPWFSIGHMIAWQLEQAHPGRKVRLIMAATGGVPLSNTLPSLAGQDTRPDIVVLCAGHNEFQARWGWSRVVNYYADDHRERPRRGLIDHVGGVSPFARLIRIAIERQDIDAPPTPKEIREVVDRPVCEPETREGLRKLFAFELGQIVDWCKRAGATPILVIPSGNDVGFDPDRSVLDPSTRQAEREAFATDFLAARQLEASDPAAATIAYRTLVDRQPLFSEAHYRLAKLAQTRGEIDEARREYALARDHDGLPMRCPSEFQEVYRTVAKAHPEVVLVDGPKVLTRLSPSGLLDDALFHDGQHPSFRAYLALAQDALDQMEARALFGLAEAALPPVDPSACADHFGMLDPSRWAEVCRRSAGFWGRLATSRYDSSGRGERAARLNRAAEAIEGGAKPEDAGVPGLGVRPPGFP